jgi:hypothetical protein
MEEEKKSNKKLLIGIGAGVVVILIIAGGVFGAIKFADAQKAKVGTKVENFINQELLGGQGDAKATKVTKEGGLYKIVISYQGNSIDTYMTKDGKKLFPQALDMEPAAAKTDTKTDASQPVTEAPKTDKPKVELFVMSYCPYGTQIEKGILPAIEALGSKVDFSLKFVSYTMHGDKENQENLLQYCIDKEQNAKLFGYLKCFLKAGDSASCLKSTGVDEAKAKACMTATAKKADVTGEKFEVQKADNEKYGVQGSPTLIVNGANISSARDSASLLKTICSAFKTAPAECQKQLSATAPSAGFGEGTASGATDATCN